MDLRDPVDGGRVDAVVGDQDGGGAPDPRPAEVLSLFGPQRERLHVRARLS
ncbi:hypothetical protein GA0070564_104120 [Micromonospora mirobrigensis]|uniref:Uncharacterized protein n=1 Tax=Micromonospora mirobrigensis TaxID=262898 RepID=A0A1C4YJ95_9ACTN|nr:hypothetical protein GA0070564_104120 [Micromonospora mirobrigensis]